MTHVVHILVGGEFLLEERPLSRPLILCDALNLATSLRFACRYAGDGTSDRPSGVHRGPRHLLNT